MIGEENVDELVNVVTVSSPLSLELVSGNVCLVVVVVRYSKERAVDTNGQVL